MRFGKTALFTLLGLAELITAGPLLDPRERTSEEDRKALGKMKLFKGPNQYPTCDDIRQAACVIAKLNNKWLWEIMKPGPGGSPTEVKIWLWKWKQEVEGFRVWPTTVKWDDVKDTMSGAADKDAAWWPAALEVAMTNLKMPNSNDGRWGGGDPAGAFHASTGKNATTECFNWGKDRTEAERNALSNKHWASVTKADYTPVVLISTNQRERKRLMEGHAYGVMTSTVRDTTRFVTLFEPNTGSLEYKWDDIFVDLDFVTHLVNFDPLIIPKSPN